MKRSTLVPVHEIPFNTIPVTEDVEKKYLNKHGYACEDFGPRGVINVQALGCSWTQGDVSTGSFPEYAAAALTERLGVPVRSWNMGLGGRSSDYMSRTLMCTVDCLKPDIVLLNFPTLDRREFFRNDGRKIKYQIEWMLEEKHNGVEWQRLGAVDRNLVKHINELVSPYDDAVNFLKNFKLMELMLESKNIMWAFSTVPVPSTVDTLKELMDMGWISRDNYLGGSFEIFDFLSEADHHPGAGSHKAHGNRFADFILTKHSSRLFKLAADTQSGAHAQQPLAS